MSPKLREIQEKLRQASARFPKWEILPAGEYSFTVSEASIKHDDDRHYDYLHVRLDCDGKLASDRFPIVDDMLFKLREFLAAVGLDADSLTDLKVLVGRSGRFTAEPQPDGKTFYKYREVAGQ
jgi:hypothetical protein